MHISMTNPGKLAVIIGATALLAAGCSSSDDTTADSEPGFTTSAQATDEGASSDTDSPVTAESGTAAPGDSDQPQVPSDPDNGGDAGEGAPDDITPIARPAGVYFWGEAQQSAMVEGDDAPGDSQFRVMFHTSGEEYTSYQFTEVFYPDLGCTGTLTPVQGSDNTDTTRTYTESITEGECDSSGTWFVEFHSGKSATATYTPDTDRYIVSVDLLGEYMDAQ